jgi:hypothetical protein
MSGHGHAPARALVVRPRLGESDLMAVANTRHGPAGHWHARPRVDGPDHDHLADPVTAVRWLRDHGVAVPTDLPTDAQLEALRAIRDHVRSLVDDPVAPLSAPLGERLARTPFHVVPADVSAAGSDPELAAASSHWDGFTDDLLLPLLDVRARADLLRRCGNPLCRFTFLDGSRNRSRRWCDPTGCGNRIRVRRHRATHPSSHRAPANA